MKLKGLLNPGWKSQGLSEAGNTESRGFQERDLLERVLI